MKKKVVSLFESKQPERKEKEETSYVKITCSSPNSEGHCDVQMDYQGDLDLLDFLLDNARCVFEEKKMQNETP